MKKAVVTLSLLPSAAPLDGTMPAAEYAVTVAVDEVAITDVGPMPFQSAYDWASGARAGLEAAGCEVAYEVRA